MGGEVVVAGAGAGQLEAICLDWDSPASLVVVCQLEAREGDLVYREGDQEYREGEVENIIGNPVYSYQLIKRITVFWRNVEVGQQVNTQV